MRRPSDVAVKAKRSGSGGMHRRLNAAWVLPQAVNSLWWNPGGPVAVKIQPRAGAPTVQMAPAARERRPLASSPGGGRHARERETSADDAGSCQRECPHHLFMLAGWAGEPDYGSFSRCGRGRRCIPAKQPVVKPTRRSAGDPSRLNRAAHRCVSVGIHAVFLPHAPCQPGASPPPGELAGLGAHVGFITGC